MLRTATSGWPRITPFSSMTAGGGAAMGAVARGRTAGAIGRAVGRAAIGSTLGPGVVGGAAATRTGGGAGLDVPAGAMTPAGGMNGSRVGVRGAFGSSCKAFRAGRAAPVPASVFDGWDSVRLVGVTWGADERAGVFRDIPGRTNTTP